VGQVIPAAVPDTRMRQRPLQDAPEASVRAYGMTVSMPHRRERAVGGVLGLCMSEHGI
jgi:hypothetical protein